MFWSFFCCSQGMWDLAPLPGIKAVPLHFECSFNHWTTRKSLGCGSDLAFERIYIGSVSTVYFWTEPAVLTLYTFLKTHGDCGTLEFAFVVLTFYCFALDFNSYHTYLFLFFYYFIKQWLRIISHLFHGQRSQFTNKCKGSFMVCSDNGV